MSSRLWCAGLLPTAFFAGPCSPAAHDDDFPGDLADRNVGFAPTIGYIFRL